MRPLIGVGLVGIGAIVVFGGMTGRLAPMLAALFSPSALDMPQQGPRTPQQQAKVDSAVDDFMARGATTP